MQFKVRIIGTDPIIMHSGPGGLDTRSPANLEKSIITRKKGSNRTEADDQRLQELEVLTSIYWTDDNRPTVPSSAIRATIENAARKMKQGPLVREGLIVDGHIEFDYDKERYGTTVQELCKSTGFSVPVVVQRSRLIRTRAKFDTPWSITCKIDTDPELVDREQLDNWFDIAGRRIGLLDWRPQKSGNYGRFTHEFVS